LSFLAIQAPGISKTCSLCGKQYLKEIFLDKDDLVQTADDATNPEPQTAAEIATEHAERQKALQGMQTSSLARILFAASDLCLYCGGKFIG